MNPVDLNWSHLLVMMAQTSTEQYFPLASRISYAWMCTLTTSLASTHQNDLLGNVWVPTTNKFQIFQMFASEQFSSLIWSMQRLVDILMFCHSFSWILSSDVLWGHNLSDFTPMVISLHFLQPPPYLTSWIPHAFF